MAWLLLLAAGLLEIVWAIALKQAHGFSRLGPSIVGISAAWVSFALLALSLRSLPAGSAYAIWTGIGIVGVAIVGIVALDESSSLARLGLLTLILAGVIGLKLVDQ